MQLDDEHIEDLILGPLDPIDDDLNRARDILVEQPVDRHDSFVIGYVRAHLDSAGDDPERAALFIRRARAMLVALAESRAVES